MMMNKQAGLIPNPFLQDHNIIPADVLDELYSRFLANIPAEERNDPLRACFQIELAHWFFVDHYCGENTSQVWKERGLMPFSQFAKLMFERSPSLRKQLPNLDNIVQEFKTYKAKVPTFGAILMNQELTKVVLVQGFGGTWGFPKGKINQDEDPALCAVREVEEETGYDASHLLCREHFVESVYQDRWTRLYFVRGVDPKSAQLKPHTRFEIKNIGWFPISELPENKKDLNVVVRPGFPQSAFHGVFPYIKRLRYWIDDKLQGKNIISSFKCYAPGRPAHILDRIYSRLPLTVSKTLNDPFKSTYIDSSTKNVDSMPFQMSSLMLTKSGVENSSSLMTSPRPPNKGGGDKNVLAQTPNETFQRLFGFPNQNFNNSNMGGFSSPNVSGPLGQLLQSNNSGVKTNINPKRRLFTSDDEEQEKESNPFDLNSFNAHKGNKKIQHNNTRNVRSATVHDPILFSPTWLNFKFDAERIMRSIISKS